MENNNQNQNTGAKGTFPGVSIAQNQIGHPVQNTQTAPSTPIENTIIPAAENVENTEDTKTYIRLETKNSEGQLSGVIEIDLISFRERGQESRYLSINTVGAGQDGSQSETNISIGNEEDFNRFKKFVSELNWND